MARKKVLPVLGRGQGAFDWVDDSHTVMRYRKLYTAPGTLYSKRLSVRGKTADECYRKMREKELEFDKEALLNLENPQLCLTDAMKLWLKKKQKRVKASTYDRNERTLENQIEGYRVGELRTVDVSPRMLQQHLDNLLFDKEYSISTIKKTYDLLSAFFRDFYGNDLNDNPMLRVRMPEVVKNVGEITEEEAEEVADLEDIVLTDDEIKRFKEFVWQEPKNGSVGRSKYGVALYFIMMTCIRAGEACALTWNDIDVDGKSMRINKTVSRIKERSKKGAAKTRVILTTPKTAQSTRIVRLSAEAIEALELHRSRVVECDYVIPTDNGQRVTVQRLYRALKGVLKGAKLSTPARDKAFGVHYLRHTGISYYLRHGIPVELVSKMAGHASIDITLKRYYHIINDQQDQLLEMMDSIG